MTEPSGGSENKPRRPVAVPAVALTAFTAIGITALLGGLGEAADAPDALGPGAVLDQALFDTKFVESRVTTEKAETQFDEDKRFVELVFDVTNKGDETASVGLPPAKPNQVSFPSFGGSLVKITPAFPEDAGPFAYALSKGGETRQLHPGVTSRVIVRYRLKDNEQPPEKMVLDVASFEFRSDFNNVTPEWSMVSKEEKDKLVPEIKARVTLPVKKGGAA
ncbi:hypothetical protein [Nonomuraea zeae]|uniref:Uncharacterized protein n=1 Tax=Nonomuraea zeae TaxID=1642303 RepID=A0A5S4EYI0_9ACTN|nr:hypothetical protein [Nonomuraea zeae]TMR08596.1 hypothetical protein ETD85_62145 [Nonomuraea zeae]